MEVYGSRFHLTTHHIPKYVYIPDIPMIDFSCHRVKPGWWKGNDKNMWQASSSDQTHTWIHPEGRGWNEMKWNHVMLCYHVMSAWVVYGLATWPCLKLEIRKYVYSSHRWPLRWPSTNDDRDGPCWYPLIQAFPHTHTHTKPLGHDFANQKYGPQCSMLLPTSHGVVLWHGTWCSNVCGIVLLAPTKNLKFHGIGR